MISYPEWKLELTEKYFEIKDIKFYSAFLQLHRIVDTYLFLSYVDKHQTYVVAYQSFFKN